MQLLPFECIPALSPELLQLRDEVSYFESKICRWMSEKKKSPPLEQVLRALGDTKVSVYCMNFFKYNIDIN